MCVCTKVSCLKPKANIMQGVWSLYSTQQFCHVLSIPALFD